MSWGVAVVVVAEIDVDAAGIFTVDVVRFVEGVPWTIGVFWCAVCV